MGLELTWFHERRTKRRKMGYEDSVYLAKLAEQAERYEGMTRSNPPRKGRGKTDGGVRAQRW